MKLSRWYLLFVSRQASISTTSCASDCKIWHSRYWKAFFHTLSIKERQKPREASLVTLYFLSTNLLGGKYWRQNTYDVVMNDMQRIEKMCEVQASENSHQWQFMFYVSFMSDELGEIAYFMNHKLFGIFYDSFCYMRSLCHKLYVIC